MRALGRSLGHYVRTSSGGAANAARKMAPSRSAAAGLLSFLRDTRASGVTAALQRLDLEGLAGRPSATIFLSLCDVLCPDGGSIDEAIAREAFVETIAECVEAGIDLENLTAAQVLEVLEAFVAHSIDARLLNDIGMNAVSLPQDINAVRRVQRQVHAFVRGAVHDAVHRAQAAFADLTQQRLDAAVREVYRSAFTLLEALADQEASR